MSTAISGSRSDRSSQQSNISELLESVDDDLIIANPTADVIVGLIDAKEQLSTDEDDSVLLITTKDLMSELRNDFVLISQLHQLIDDEIVELRCCEDLEPQTPLFITPSSVSAVLSLPTDTLTITSEDEDQAEPVYETYQSIDPESTNFSFRTPPLGRVRETFLDSFGEDAAEDLFELLEYTHENGEADSAQFNAALIVLLIGAKHNEMLYDIGKWGEDVGVASKATFSRSKTQLEDRNLITTSNVPIDVGRPRLRLALNEDRFDEPTIEDLAQIVEDLS